MSLPTTQGWNEMALKVPPNPSHSVILWPLPSRTASIQCWFVPCYRGAGRNLNLQVIYTPKQLWPGQWVSLQKGVGRGKPEKEYNSSKKPTLSTVRVTNLSRETMLQSEIRYCFPGWLYDKFSMFSLEVQSCLFHSLYLCKSQSALPWNPVTAASHSRIDLFL